MRVGHHPGLGARTPRVEVQSKPPRMRRRFGRNNLGLGCLLISRPSSPIPWARLTNLPAAAFGGSFFPRSVPSFRMPIFQDTLVITDGSHSHAVEVTVSWASTKNITNVQELAEMAWRVPTKEV